jgi:hypothetical protein
MATANAKLSCSQFPMAAFGWTPRIVGRDRNWHHWKTSPARASTDGGIVNPSAFAVLRLTIS